MTLVGVLSDTHGVLHPKVRQALEGVDHIIHAGDIGSPEVLSILQTIAPVTAVSGNCDLGDWAQGLPARAEVELDGVRVIVGHVAGRLNQEAASSQPESLPGGKGGRFTVTISGHTHLASIQKRDGVLHLNPGSAGHRRFGRPRTVARLEINPRSPSRPSRGEAAAPSGAAASPLSDSGPHVNATILTVES